jgi:hypothetical protein
MSLGKDNLSLLLADIGWGIKSDGEVELSLVDMADCGGIRCSCVRRPTIRVLISLHDPKSTSQTPILCSKVVFEYRILQKRP